MNTRNFTTENDICSLVTEGMRSFGTFLSKAQVETRLKDYFDETGLDRNNPRLIFGQILGLDKIKELMAKIEDYNFKEPETKIAGIRIYNTMSKREFLPAPDNGIFKADVVVLPILENGRDYYGPDTRDGSNTAVGGAMPCPNQC